MSESKSIKNLIKTTINHLVVLVNFKTMRLTVFLLFFTTCVCSQSIDIQGHRGARGIFPENTIPAFIYALDQGVTTLELDVVITKDKRVIVSHEPWMSHEICLYPDGTEIAKQEEKSQNIFSLTYNQIEQYDCGSKGNTRFPEQMKMKASKPLLSDVIIAAERHVKGVTHREVNYNIEIKSSPEGDNNYHPVVSEFSELVYQVINDYLPFERVTIQSFDFRVLKYWNENHTDIKLVALIDNLKSIEKNVEGLGFTPHIYSPYYKLLTKKKVDTIHNMGMKVIPWTINNKADMTRMIEIGVDGIITDYPNRAGEILQTRDQSNDR